jgi:hypothetical protein
MAIYFECVKCSKPTENKENEYDEHVCDSCLENEAEAAYESHIASFHDGGSTKWKSLAEMQIEARRMK